MMIPIDQTREFKGESLRYVSSHLHNNLDFKNVFPNSVGNIRSILDVGCGNGDFLYSWKQYYQAEQAMGVEPSQEAVKLLKEKWGAVSEMQFFSAFAHSLPFETDSFDLVIVWSVLHWVGRNEYLQSLGEVIRVSGRWLVVMDFVAQKDYRVPYSHKNGLFTYKQDFQPLVEYSGIMKAIEVIRWWVNPTDNTLYLINEKELDLFEKNILSYHARKMVVFEKNYEALPIKENKDFY